MADVSNYTIENASGANVRIDLNNVFSAIQSLNSKSTDLAQSQCVAGMPFLNTATNTLKIRNSTNNGFTDIGNIDTANLGLLPRTGGAMSGVLELDDSNSASTPALSFDGDEDLGLFRKSANIMGFSSGGTEQMVFDANGLTLRTQNEVRFGDSDSSNFTSFKAAGTLSGNTTFTLPSADGSSGQFLKTNGSGVLSFATVDFTSLNASNLTSGTIPTARFPSNFSPTTVSATTSQATRFRSNNSSSPVFQNSSGSETAAGRLVRACVEFDGFRGGNASDNFASISGQFNVSSITDHSEGIFTANFSSSVPSNATTCATIDIDRFTFNNHCVIYLSSTGGATTSGVKIHITNPNNSGHVLDKNSTNIAVFA